MIEVIEARIRQAGQRAFYNPRGLPLKIKDTVILESERGIDYGIVLSALQVLPDAEVQTPLFAVVRVADEKDLQKIEETSLLSRETLPVCRKKIAEHGLQMKLVRAEYAFDLSKLIFYFTAEGRVDFRALVRDLAAVFKVRIELRQIGARDEARIFGGLGPCGRGLCCSTFLKDFKSVTIKMARDQNLSLNPSKISGVCGRLMCCLAYENEHYQDARKELPKIGQTLYLGDTLARVVDVNLLKKLVCLEYQEGETKKIEWVEYTEPTAAKR